MGLERTLVGMPGSDQGMLTLITQSLGNKKVTTKRPTWIDLYSSKMFFCLTLSSTVSLFIC